MKGALLVFCFTLAALPAGAAPSPLPSQRHLVFHFEFGARAVAERRIGTAESSGSGEVIAGRTARSESDEHRKGEITLDVVAATSAGGLVVDVEEEAQGHGEPLTRVVIMADGMLRYLPGSEVSPEEAELLPLLGREVIGAALRSKGDAWEIPQTAPNFKQSTKYEVLDATPPLTELVQASGAFVTTGIHEADGSSTGKITFNPKFIVPVAASLTSHAHNKEPDVLTTTDTSLQLTLVSDSWEK